MIDIINLLVSLLVVKTVLTLRNQYRFNVLLSRHNSHTIANRLSYCLMLIVLIGTSIFVLELVKLWK